MPDIEIYTTIICPFCHQAKMLLQAKGIDFREIDVMIRSSQRRKMSGRACSSSVPQTFVAGTHIGDYTRLYALDAEGKLNAKIGLDS
ncbi:MAG: glutaredoxin domain-containing protein [Pseudomonadota bacterium]|nr:glutaredoxin domain-containing protein [Pseudomonadota bacterium]